MPDQMPTGADLEAYLVTLGLYTAGSAELGALELEGKAAAAVVEWETRTGYRPFLANGSDTTRIYDPPYTRFLELAAGVLSVSALMTGVGVASPGTARAEGTDFWLERAQAAYEDAPFEVVTFACSPGGARRSITITGRWGYAATVPDDAWQAILARGAWLCAPQAAMSMGGGAEVVRVLSSEVRYPSAATGGPLAAQQAAWTALFEAAVRRYKRVEIA
jgi:hypothetical protein